MADITITDNLDLNVSMQLPDDSPLAKANLKTLVAAGKQFFDSLGKPLDQVQVQSIALGGTFTSPDLLAGEIGLTVGAGMNCGLTLVSSDSTLLFPDDGFSPKIPVNANQAWLGFELDLSLDATASASHGVVGVSVAVASQVAACTWTLFSGPPLPPLLQGFKTALSNFSLTTSAEDIRQQLPNTVNTTEITGSITAAVSLEQPFNLNPLASADLPFNRTVSVQPTVTLSLGTSLEIAGDFQLRSYRLSQDLVTLGIYKKRGTTLAVTLTAAAGIAGDIGSTDVLGALLNKALPGVDVTAAGLSGDKAAKLNDVIKDGLSRSLSAQLNATCSAAITHEAALLYELHLNEGDRAATDNALQLAMKGDWTKLQSLPNAKLIRNIAVETVDKKRAVTLNLFGFYSAISTTDYLKRCTILVDESGQLSIVDTVNVSRISAATAPNAADTAKLRKALMEDFLCTASYAVVSGKLQLRLTAMQSYLDYNRNMGPAEMRQNIALAYALGLAAPGSLDDILTGTQSFQHAIATATVRYDTPALLDIFYTDPASRTPRSRPGIEQQGRAIMCLFLNPADDTDRARLNILNSNAAWLQMDTIGNTAAFHSIPELAGLSATQLGAVTADWVSIVWWAKALVKVAPAISAALAALDSTPPGNPTHNPTFMKARQNLSNILGAVTRDTDAAFVHGWGAAVLFALSGKHGVAEMDLTSNSVSRHLGA